MSIRTQILLYISTLSILLIGVLLLFIYSLLCNHRESEFHEELAIKLQTTVKLLTAVKIYDSAILETIDESAIYSIYDEKHIIFNENKEVIYTSLDDTPIPNSKNILDSLSTQNKMINRKDDVYDVIGLYLEQDGKIYYGISKAYDISGYLTLSYIKKILIIGFISISIFIFIMLYYLSGRITYSILQVTKQIKSFDFEKTINPIVIKSSNYEIKLLVERFNELMSRMHKAFLFQKHAIQHISHELKTPISILVSNFEIMEKEKDMIKIKDFIKTQKENTKNLSDVINALLEIAKVESGKNIEHSKTRIDDLIFDISHELSFIYPDFKFSILYDHKVDDVNLLSISVNHQLMKTALENLMLNCCQYSSENNAKVTILAQDNSLRIDFINNGKTINEEERQFLFQHFFRGENSKGVRGFGLGLVLVHKIISLYNGTISYNIINNANAFSVILPLNPGNHS